MIATGAPVPVLLYNGECAVCRAIAGWVRRVMPVAEVLRLLPPTRRIAALFALRASASGRFSWCSSAPIRLKHRTRHRSTIARRSP